MRCPVCEGTDLAISSREGVEIDFCPQCRGVWLDRGELDKVIDRAGAALGGRSGGERSDRDRDDRDRDTRGRDDGYDRSRDDRDDRGRDDRHRDERDRDDRGYDPRRKRRRSFLDDLFEMD